MNVEGSAPAVQKPGITSTARTADYWAAANEGRLLLQRCRQCGRHQHYPRSLCASCWSPDLDWTAAAGTGVVWTYTTVSVPGHPGWLSEVPYVLAIVELDEGPRLMSNVVGDDVDQVAVGRAVELSPTVQSDTGQTLLTFRLTPTGAPGHVAARHATAGQGTTASG